jgi:hypothetical protein
MVFRFDRKLFKYQVRLLDGLHRHRALGEHLLEGLGLVIVFLSLLILLDICDFMEDLEVNFFIV